MPELLLADDCNPYAVLPLVKNRGFGIEAQSFCEPAVLDGPAEALAEHRRLLAGVALCAMHGPFADLCPGSSDPLVRQVARQRSEQGLAIAGELGIRQVILHHGYVPNTSQPARWVARSADFWRGILARAPAQTHIHLENLLDDGPGLLLDLLQVVGDPRLGVCLDLGHAHAFSRVPVVEWVTALGTAVTYVHLHDNGGTRDEHLPLGQGNLPLHEVLAALQAHAPGALWALEADAAPSLAWLEENGFLPKDD